MRAVLTEPYQDVLHAPRAYISPWLQRTQARKRMCGQVLSVKPSRP